MTRRGKYYIGMDTGKNTALARWNVDTQELESVRTFTFWEAYEALRLWFKIKEHRLNTIMVIEDCTKNKTTFGRDNMNRAILDKKAQCVGMVKRDTKLWIEFCINNDLDYQLVRPYVKKSHKGIVQNYWDGKMNEHEIDAAFLVVGKQ